MRLPRVRFTVRGMMVAVAFGIGKAAEEPRMAGTYRRGSHMATLLKILAIVSVLAALQQLLPWEKIAVGLFSTSGPASLRSVPAPLLAAARAAVPGYEPFWAVKTTVDQMPGFEIECRDEHGNSCSVVVYGTAGVYVYRPPPEIK
jgi:hypothetical protein